MHVEHRLHIFGTNYTWLCDFLVEFECFVRVIPLYELFVDTVKFRHHLPTNTDLFPLVNKKLIRC